MFCSVWLNHPIKHLPENLEEWHHMLIKLVVKFCSLICCDDSGKISIFMNRELATWKALLSSYNVWPWWSNQQPSICTETCMLLDYKIPGRFHCNGKWIIRSKVKSFHSDKHLLGSQYQFYLWYFHSYPLHLKPWWLCLSPEGGSQTTYSQSKCYKIKLTEHCMALVQGLYACWEIFMRHYCSWNCHVATANSATGNS